MSILFFVSVSVTILDISCEWNSAVFVLWLTHFTWGTDALKAHLCYCIVQNILCFKGVLVFHCVCIPNFLYLFLFPQALRLASHLHCYAQRLMDMGVLWCPDVKYFGGIPKSRIAKWCYSSIGNVLRNLHSVFQYAAVPFCIPTNSV